MSYAINLTPDNETGPDTGSEDMFRPGAEDRKHHGKVAADPSADALAGVPQFFDSDLKAMFAAYLRTVPAVSNRIPDPVFATP